MPVTFLFEGAPPPADLRRWQEVAESVFRGRAGKVVVRSTRDGWRVLLAQAASPGFSTLPGRPPDEHDLVALCQALLLAGIDLAP